MKLTVTVTAEDIKRGGHACYWCPVHHAICRAMGPKRPGISVRPDSLLVNSDIVDFPEAVETWIFDYDAGVPVGPINFEIELPT